MIDQPLLEFLVCPENQTALAVAEPAMLARLNRAIAQGQVRNRGGHLVKEPLEAGLVREDKTLLYPIVDGIPVMLIDEAIAMERID
jgi:uncharacterized protein YbaR (Trm112 family)